MADDLFADYPPEEAGPYIVPNVTVPREARPRVSRQCLQILDRLRQGPVGLKELMGIAANYTARISELRQAGFKIPCFRHDEATGETWYRLVEGHSEKT